MESKNKGNVLLECKELLQDGKTQVGQISRLLEELRKYIEENAIRGNFLDSLNRLSADYDCMMHFSPEGSNDLKRSASYWNFQCQIYSLIQDLLLQENLKSNSTLAAAKLRAMAIDLDEIFGKGQAICRQDYKIWAETMKLPYGEWLEKYKDIHQNVAEFQSMVFSYVLTMPQWNLAIQRKFEQYIHRLDWVTGSLVVTAITISTLQVFDIRKLCALFEIYQSSKDRDIKERAFVGAMLCLNEKEYMWCDLQASLVKEYCSDQDSLARILDFQKQIIFLLDTEKDKKEARSELDLTDFIKKNPKFKKLKEMGESDNDFMDNLLSPEEEEEIFQRLQRTWKVQDEMEKAGTDIYFKGFSLMKNFGFFHSMVNWLTPFYSQNPVLLPLVNELGDDGAFIQDVEKWAPLCNGDCYSFCLVLAQMLKQVPVMKRMIPKKVFAPSKEEGYDEEMRCSWTRRKYLQDLYRFFVVAPMRNGFVSPFAKEDTTHVYFFSQEFFQTGVFQKINMSLCRFLVNRKDYARLDFFIYLGLPESRDAYIIRALYHFNMGEYEPAAAEAATARTMGGDKKPALQIEAKCSFLAGDYQGALNAYQQLLELMPDNMGIERRMALCMIEMKDYDHALVLLYKLDYQYPNNLDIMRPLAWALIEKGDIDKAIDFYRKIMAVASKEKSLMAEDYYNIGICNLIKHDIQHAQQAFVRYTTQFEKTDLLEKIKSDRELLVRNEVKDDEVMMLADAVMKNSGEKNGDVEESTSKD